MQKTLSGEMRSADREDRGIVAYFLTLGLSRPGDTELISGLEADIREVAPKVIGIVYTEDSADNADRLEKDLGGEEYTFRRLLLPEAFDLEKTYEKMRNFLLDVQHEFDLASSEMAINYTSGTKVMAAGALFSGLARQVEALRYLPAPEKGASREENGAVETSPSLIYEYRDLDLARRLARELRFQSAVDIMLTLEESAAERPETLVRYQYIRRLFEGYGAWDSFQYEASVGAFHRASEFDLQIESVPVNPIFVPTEEHQEALNEIVSTIGKNNFHINLLADLFNNALRRLHETKANDAVARAYRCLEMLAQQKLLEAHGVDTDRVDVRKVPPRNRDQYAASRSTQDGRIRIGLRKSYELLLLLDDQLGKIYDASPDLQELLGQRYKSLMAHGYHPLSMVQARAFVQETGRLIESEYGEFHDLRESLRFPWMRQK